MILSGDIFEDLYLRSRGKENRIYTDAQVKQLPYINTSHVHYPEWQIRKRSAERLIYYLEKKRKPLSILEVGCGNGWLSGRLAAEKNFTVTGSDINEKELRQAERVFKNSKIEFISGEINSIEFGKKFDIIIFAASIQYFPFFDQTIRQTLSLLEEAGEIHILDSYFYKPADIASAKKRSLDYYQSLGIEEMAGFYFHHSSDSLNSFHHEILFNPLHLKNKLTGTKDPFPWIRIKYS